MKLFEKIMYPILVIFLFVAIYVSRTNIIYFESSLAVDDGLFQWMIFYTLLFASILCFYRAYILKPFRGSVFATFSVIAGIVFFGFAMDEISCAQRVIGYNAPQFFLDHNTKLQVNFHHLVINGFRVNNIIFTLSVKILATLYFIVLPFFYNKLNQIKSFVNRFAIPLPRYSQIGAYVVLGALVNLIPSGLNYVIFEFGFYWILVLMIYNPINEEVFLRKSLVR